ncbi:MAG TPA: tRNA uridine(34) 5-carboxymethylaminomethyl modification radical SAM/GNAT enzyme Elp3 [archaeon]|nr:tRNA uridine(34) 5-carboxymethylaminomethyl modification radical SAM/GNAT enzyme Elp3 [archaeon]
MDVAKQLLDEIRSGCVRTQDELELAKIKLSNGADLIKNSDISSLLKETDSDYSKLRKFLQIKNVRTASGVANIAVMWLHGSHANSCPAKCIYCPQGESNGVLIAPKSYTGIEPTTLRAIRNEYDPYKQTVNRLKQLNIIGHPTDKCELIIMGGTFMATPSAFQEEFVKRCLDGFNGKPSASLTDAQLANETARNRCIGLTIETRADFCTDEQIDRLLALGCTRVEIGVQSVDDELLRITKRGHGAKANIDAIRRLKEKGLKVCVHWMPGLTGMHGQIDEAKEIEMFKQLFTADYMPDELKIYPTLVIQGTELHDMWKSGRYTPLTDEQMIRLLIEFKKIIPPYVRLKRVMRDISEHNSEAGARVTNLRQLAAEKMEFSCKCIRCREVGHLDAGNIEPKINVIKYNASNGKEIFIEYSGGALLGFIRLRLDNTNIARIRELHVYGSMTPIGEESRQAQHKGVGKILMAQAEQIAKDNGCGDITVTSGIGVREYYRKLGYNLEGSYMTRALK